MSVHAFIGGTSISCANELLYNDWLDTRARNTVLIATHRPTSGHQAYQGDITTTKPQLFRRRKGRSWGNLARRAVGQAVLILILLFLLALTIAPIFNLIASSLNGKGTIYIRFWENYSNGWRMMKTYIANSLISSVSTVIGVVFLSSISGYVFARHQFPGKQFLFLAIISLLMIPSIFTLIPSFMIINDLHLIDTRWALILPWMASGQVFGILICRGFFSGLPEELFEAARIDGAGDFILYSRIAVPISLPILATVAIMNLLNTYNDFLWPLLVIRSPAKQVVSVGLREVSANWGSRGAAYIFATIPFLILFTFSMRYFIQGTTSGAIKA
ncbi:MAG: carbohydrate ABC transporter permease [Anaerolineae bacterium]